jgi:hypothetical protein
LHNILWEGPNPGLRRYRRSCAAGPYAALLELYTTAAEGALGNARRYLKSRAQIEQLRTALESREAIDQAKACSWSSTRSTRRGVRPARRPVAAEQRQVRDIAAQLVADGSRADT